MQTKLANDSSPERYVVEIDGITKSEYSVFVKALTASLQLNKSFRTIRSSCATLTRRRPCMPIDVTRRRFRSSDESDQLPYAKAAAHRAVRATIGQELKAYYEVARDLPCEISTLLMHLDCAESSY